MSGISVTPHPATPVPNGVRADTGAARPPLSEDQALLIASPPAIVTVRSQAPEVLAVAGSVDDPADLTQTGWGILFASDADPRIKEQLQPLLDLRRKQVQDPKLFRVFEGPTGVQPGQSAGSWAMSRSVSLAAPVDPRKGVPYYLLIVGTLERIPFEFQTLFDLQWAVGRLHFDDIADYGRYAQKVVAYEDPGFRPVQHKNAAAWLTRNPLDIATSMLSGAILEDFGGADKLGERRGFSFDCFSGEQASKQQLQDIMRGNITGGPPALLFTGSHGAEWPMMDPAQQRRFQGALVTQAWSSGQPLDDTNQFSGDDVPADASLHGMIAFLFACYSGGCPAEDNFFFNPDGSKISVAPAPLIARLPQVMLSRGALAVIAHVDRAFTYTFEDLLGTPQCQTLRTPLEGLMKGQPIGLAVDAINLQWSTLAAQLGVALGGSVPSAQGPQPPFITNLYIARDDARNYMVLGDPAVRLRVKDLA
ncbi:MAG: hypothetical protein QOJ99_5052 [Bryobacterales bacterium]|jgi:hypothetical protein|nr:hypothetical protein [Bryobacterales bacterium]